MGKKQKEKQEKFAPVKRMTFGEFRDNLTELLPKMMGRSVEIKINGPWVAAETKGKNSRRYRISAMYEKYLNSCETCITESPFKETAEWIATRLSLDLKMEGIDIVVKELKKIPDTTQRTVQEINPKIEIEENNQKYRFMDKLRNRLLDIFYDNEFEFNEEHLAFIGTDVDLRTEDLYAMYNEYKDAENKNPAKKVAKYAEKKYDEYMDRGR